MLFNRRACCGMMPQCQCMPEENPMDGQCGCAMDPIVEAPIEKCVKRDIFHEVQHVCPVHTKVINNHIYRHTYVPQYSCSEENVVCNMDQGSCCNFQ